MRRIRFLAYSSDLLKALLPILLFGSRLYAADSCQPTAKPSELIRTITEAEHKAKMSTDILRLMLPCPGTPVMISSVTAALSAGFSVEQADLILSAFRVTPLNLLDLAHLVLAPIQDSYKPRLLASASTVSISAREINATDLRLASPEQLKLISDHCSLRLLEPELQLLLESKEQAKIATFLETSLDTMPIKAERTVKLLAQCPQRSRVVEKLWISDPRLWAVALKAGMPVSDLAMLQGPKEVSMTDMLRYCKQQGVSDSVTMKFLIEQESHWKPISKADVCTGSFSSQQMERLFGALGHPALTLSPDCVASLKAQGMADETILSLTKQADKTVFVSREMSRDGRFPMPPDIPTVSYADPLGSMMDLSGGRSRMSQGSSNSSDGSVFRIGGEVSQPVLIHKVEPEYSKEARKDGLAGTVLLSIVVDANGTPHNIHVVHPLGLGLDEKAIEAVMQWRFRPALKDGRSVAVQAQVEINFRLLNDPPTAYNFDRLPVLSAGKSKTYRDRHEYDLFLKLTQTSDATSRLSLLDEWQIRYGQTDYMAERMRYYIVTLSQLSANDHKYIALLLRKCNEALRQDKSDFRAAYFLCLYGPQYWADRMTPDLMFQIKEASNTVASEIDTAFAPSTKPASVTDEDFARDKGQVLTVARRAKLSMDEINSKRSSNKNNTQSADLHVEILQVQWTSSPYAASGFGKGNVSGSQPRQGFNFTFSCSAPFMETNGGGYYPANWKKPGTKLVIVTTKIGSPNKHDKCELSTSLQPYVFEVRSSVLQTISMQ